MCVGALPASDEAFRERNARAAGRIGARSSVVLLEIRFIFWNIELCGGALPASDEAFRERNARAAGRIEARRLVVNSQIEENGFAVLLF